MEEHFSTKKIHNHQPYYTIMYKFMNIFKSFDLNSTTLIFFENFDGIFFLMGSFMYV
jgi:hypothetical protein